MEKGEIRRGLVSSGRRRVALTNGERLPSTLGHGTSGESGEQLLLCCDPRDTGEVMGEFCGEVRGKKHSPEVWGFGELNGKCSVERLFLPFMLAKLHLSISPGAEALRSHKDLLPSIGTCMPLSLPFISDEGEYKCPSSGTFRKLLLPTEDE